MEESFLKYIETSIRKNWEKSALTDYKGASYSYKDAARKIEKLHILFDSCGIQKGDRIALCSRNMSSWGIAFLATLTYGAVAVPILNEFKPDNIHHIVNHSEARLFFVGDEIWDNVDEAAMPMIEGFLRMEDYSLRYSRSEVLTNTRKHLNEIFGTKYPDRFLPEYVNYECEDPESLAMINYTSGTTSSSKGVMLPYRCLRSNLQFAIGALGINSGECVVSMLPMAHMYGLMFEFLYEFSIGMHVYFLSKAPSPKVISEAFAEIRPHVIITVPLVIEKIIRKRVFPTIEKPIMKLLLNIPVVSDKICESIHQKVREALGGRFRELIIGGAALSKEVEGFLKKIHLEFTVGYGMTECGPILAYSPWSEFVAGSCGKTAPRMELKIDSEDPQHIVGEILAKGDNVMKGYFKNEEATALAITDGWLHTGDLGLIDEEGNLFIKGRSKNMILGANGQNIYPEEIEDKINNLPYVTESIVMENNHHLVALVYPDFEALNDAGVRDAEVQLTIESSIKELNKVLPLYSQIGGVRIYNEEFEKTPKRSIKRFMYQH